MPIHLKIGKNDLAKKVVTVGDPNRASLLANSLLDYPKLINENRGLLSYTGTYKGERISIVTHGIGMPSALIVFEELVSLGAKAIIRFGTSGSLKEQVKIGDIVIAESAGHFNSSAIRQYFDDIIPPNGFSFDLINTLVDNFKRSDFNFHVGPIISSDAFYSESKDLALKLSRIGFFAIEMECAGLAMIGWLRGLKTGCVLYVTNHLLRNGEEMLDSAQINKKMVSVATNIFDALTNFAV
ncbi:MAG: purine-nucleoside phosphorylase [Fervidicoccus sp.]